MNSSHLEIFIDYYAAVNESLTRSRAITDFHATRNWFGPAWFDRILTDQNAQDVCIIIDSIRLDFLQGSTPQEAMAKLVRRGARAKYTLAKLKLFDTWVAPKEVKAAKRPSFGNVVMLK